MRIAIMMLAHKDERQTQRLINHLSNDFDIYVHIDKRCQLKISESKNIFAYKKYETYWGSFNLVLATLYLLREAFEKGYDRYLLISGQDLPIKTNEEIKMFFQNNYSEYIEITKIPNPDGWPNMNRLTAYYLNDKYHGAKNKKIQRFLLRVCNKLLKIKPRKIDYDFYGGSQWTNYTHNCVKKIFEYLENNSEYINRYKWTSCSDEIFFQTIIAKLDGLLIENNCLRYADWDPRYERPKILREEDFEKIIKLKALFVRKFDENVDKNIIERIYERIGEINKSKNKSSSAE